MTINELHDYCRYLFDENHDTKRAGLIPPTRTVCTFSASNSTMPEKCTD